MKEALLTILKLNWLIAFTPIPKNDMVKVEISTQPIEQPCRYYAFKISKHILTDPSPELDEVLSFMVKDAVKKLQDLGREIPIKNYLPDPNDEDN